MIEVSLLGPPRVHRDGVLVAFDTRKAVALLAHLALTDRPRPRDALADLLWPGTDPAHARGALRRTLSTLRGAIGAELVEATRDHVRLRKGPAISVDVDRFRARRAAGDLDGAVAEFRGDFLEGFSVREAPEFEDWVQSEGAALRRELSSTLAGLAAVHEAAGTPAAAVAAVQRWLAVDPLHEPAHRALIRLYAASGDRAAALRQYRECVRTLSRDLGVPPLAETTQVYEAVNRGSYGPPEPTQAPVPVPGRQPVTAAFVGRDDDLRALRRLYDGIAVDGRVVLLEGEAGIGKTRLAEELVSGLRRSGAHVLTGRAYEDESGLAYSPIVDALRDRSRDGDGWLGGVPRQALQEAARLVPDLVSDRPAGNDRLTDRPGAETRFLAGVWDTLAAAASGSAPGVLVIDDAQWADDATLGLLAYGLRRLAGRPLLVVLTWRTPHDHPLRGIAIEVARTGGGSVLRLERLDEDAVGALVRAARPDEDDPAVARRLWETTEGVPLLLVEYLRTLSDERDHTSVPTGARRLLQARLGPISETGRQVLAAAAVLGRSFGVDTVRAVSGRTDEETVAALEEAVGRGLLREGREHYDFAHDLLRTIALDETSLARRRLLHGRAADALRGPAAVVARHLQMSGREHDAALAFREAGQQALAVFANAEALDHLRAALALGHPDRTALQTAIGDLQTVMGSYADALVSLETAAAASGPDELGPVERRLGRLHHRRGQFALAEAHLRAALVATSGSDTAARAGITADLALARQSQNDRQEARALADQSRALAERAGDIRARCQAHNLLGILATADGDLDTALENLQRSRTLADEIGDRDLSVAALNNQALAERSRGDLRRATDLTVTALTLCAVVGDRHREAALHNNLADLLQASGRSEEAMAHLKSAVEIFAEVGADDEPQPEIWKLVRW
ncbi:MAG: transcriptional activator domain protein [Nocardioidaceae bacterium]|nr:transcriptional activator domain protein [Nocardioidaceae bacterium]